MNIEKFVGLLISSLILTTACSPENEAAPAQCSSTTAIPALGLAEKGLQGPPLATVTANGCDLQLGAFEFGWGFAAGGALLPAEMTHVEPADKLLLAFPSGVKSVTITSRLMSENGICTGPTFDGEATPDADGTFKVSLGGKPGTHRVIIAMTADGGSAKYAFDWETTSTGPVREPSGQAGIRIDDSGHADLNGQLIIQNLADASVPMSAVFEVTSANGISERIESSARPVSHRCVDDPVVYFFRTTPPPGPHSGLAPYRYDVVLTIDESEHRAVATWSSKNGQSLPLEFTPPLPQP